MHQVIATTGVKEEQFPSFWNKKMVNNILLYWWITWSNNFVILYALLFFLPTKQMHIEPQYNLNKTVIYFL